MNHFAHAMRLPRLGTALTLIDIQEKLAAVMPPEALGSVIANAQRLLSAAQVLALPVLVTEQYPKGLGATVPQLREELSEGVLPIEKVEFSCARVPAYMERLRDGGIRQVVLTGMEAHVCVLQTAVELLQIGVQAWVAEDAVCSRTEVNRQAAIRLLERAGAVVAPTETILFFLLERAGTPEFREISKLVK